MKSILGLAMAVLLGSAVPAAVASSLPTIDVLVASFDDQSLSGAGISAAGKDLQLGHLTLEFGTGHLTPIRAGDTVVGVFFSGSGQFRYASSSVYEAPFLARNVEEGSKYELVDSTIVDSFTTAAIYSSQALETLFEGSTWNEGTANPTATTAFARHRSQRSEDQGVAADAQIAQALLEVGTPPAHHVEITGSKEDVVWSYDPLVFGLESFAVLEETKSQNQLIKNRRYPETLSTQAIGRDRLDPHPIRFRLTGLDVELVNPEGRELRTKVHETIQIATPLQTLEFGLVDEVLGSVGVRGVSQWLHYEVVSLHDGSGRPLPYSHRDDGLIVQLPEPVGPGQEVVLNLELAGDLLARPNNDNYWRLTLDWYPSPYLWEAEAFTYRAVIKVADPFEPFSSGATIRRWREGELACAEFEESRPMGRPALMAGKYKTISVKDGDRTVKVWSYASNQPRAAKTIGKLALAFMEFYEPYMGEYPFAEINIVEINSLGFGQAPPGVIYITREAFEPRTDEATRLYSEGINARIAHEVAHAWWGHVARLATYEDQWISEAVADYYSAVAMASLKAPSEFDSALAHWLRGAKDSKDRGTIYLGNFTAGDRSFQNRQELLYQRGPVMLHALRQEVGDDTFFTILKSFLRSFPGQPGRTKDFIDLSSFVAKRDLRPWFDRYLFGTELPELKK